MKLIVVNCGIGNVGSVRSMYRRLGLRVELVDAPCRLDPDDALILPGVGSFDFGAEAIDQCGLRSFLCDAAAAGHSLLGICLGMQLLCRGSEEGSRAGLGLIPGDVVRLNPGPERVRIPHMGWNVVKPSRSNPLLPMGGEEQRFYFTHSYRVRCDSDEEVWATTVHGTEFPSVIGSGNVMGVQFHPEKSHRFGKSLLERFASLAQADA